MQKALAAFQRLLLCNGTVTHEQQPVTAQGLSVESMIAAIARVQSSVSTNNPSLPYLWIPF